MVCCFDAVGSRSILRSRCVPTEPVSHTRGRLRSAAKKRGESWRACHSAEDPALVIEVTNSAQGSGSAAFEPVTGSESCEHVGHMKAPRVVRRLRAIQRKPLQWSHLAPYAETQAHRMSQLPPTGQSGSGDGVQGVAGASG